MRYNQPGHVLFILVLAYDVSYFSAVNERGEDISHERVRRDTAENKQTFYNITISNLTLHLSLTPNKHLLAPGFHIETKHSNGSMVTSAPTHRSFYHGHVSSYPDSSVALSGDDKLVSTLELLNYGCIPFLLLRPIDSLLFPIYFECH